MKKWKSLLSLVLALILVLPAGTAFAQEDKVEITFCVGDETLLINGTAVTVEKPYVVGEGVTLVPLRVITEAFGATVDWEDTTRSITLTYPGVSILLQIDNPIAEVNGKAETLLAAPELPNSSTMVPLRFISETFGADVSYDEETEKITVVKGSSETDGLLEGAVDSKNIGDNYYNWTMETPLDMPMVERTFDGTYTAFENETGYIELFIDAVADDYNFEKDFADAKTSFMGSTLVKADKNTKNPNKQTMHFQAKDKESFLNIRQIVTKDYCYVVYGVFDLEATEEKDEAVRIMNTFDLGFQTEDSYDLSNVQNGIRRFTDEHLKIGIDLPADFYQLSSDSSINLFWFEALDPEDTISSITFGVYSTAESGDAKAMAEEDYLRNKRDINEDIATFCNEVTENQYGDFPVFEYDYTAKGTSGEEYMRDVFFTLGDYTYNVTVSVKLPMENMSEYVTGILNSVSAETLDPSDAGILMRNAPDSDGETFTASFEDGTVEVPVNYQEQLVSGVDTALYNIYTGVGITFQRVMVTLVGNNPVADEIKRLEAKFAIQAKNDIVETTTMKTIGKFTYGTFTYKTTENNETSYYQIFGMYRSGYMYLVSVGYPELAYSEKNRQEVLDILKTLKF